MEPTIKAGDLVLVMLWPAGNSKVGRGDIIVFRDPEKPESLYVKRAVAIGGNTVELRDGNLFLDGLPYARPPQSMGSAVSIEACAARVLTRYHCRDEEVMT